KGTCRLAGALCKCLDVPSGSRPACNLLHKTVVGRCSRSLQLKRLTVLALATGPLRETQIDASSHTCGRPDLSGLDEERLRIDANFGELLGQLRARTPMGDDAALVEQTNFTQCEGAGADRADAPRPHAEALQRGQGPPIFSQRVNPGTARNEQSVNGDAARQRVGNQFHARGGADRSGGYGGDPDRVGWGRALLIRSRQRLCWSGDIDKLGTVIGKDDDSPAWHFLPCF